MSENLSQEINDMDDEIALPRKNGELQFEQPWEARAFGLAVALNGEGAYPWKNFSESLAAEIGQAESTGVDSTYYERWYAALEKLVVEKGLISADELEARAVTQARYDNHEIDSLDVDSHHHH